MKEYDYIIIGGGTSGLKIVFNALSQDSKVALINKGPVGGTCFNFGCVPSKILIYYADLITMIRNVPNQGIAARIESIDFGSIMAKMRQYLETNRRALEEQIQNSKNLDFYSEETSFTGDHTLNVGGENIRGRHIFIASGSREIAPAIKGIEDLDYLTHISLLNLENKPDNMIIIGGGYVAAEYAHFFASMGTDVTILQRAERLVPNEEPEISDFLKKQMEKRLKVHTNITAVEARKLDNGYTIIGEDRSTGEKKEFRAEKIFVATGRQSNADILQVKKSGIDTDEKGYIKVDSYLETSQKNIWAVGDAINKLMFTHSGDREAEIAWNNAVTGNRKKMDFSAVPHAIYTWPQIASVGMTEEEAKKSHEILVGRAQYSDNVIGDAMAEEGFVKAVVEKGTNKILGLHIIGNHAPLLIQEVTNTMAKSGTVGDLNDGMHIFPSLSELVPEAIGNLREV